MTPRTPPAPKILVSWVPLLAILVPILGAGIKLIADNVGLRDDVSALKEWRAGHEKVEEELDRRLDADDLVIADLRARFGLPPPVAAVVAPPPGGRVAGAREELPGERRGK